MKDITITRLDYQYVNIYKTFFDSIARSNKYFLLDEHKEIFIINNGHIDLGIILVSDYFGYKDIEIFQAPRVCRLSIITLIECSVLLSKQYIDNSDFNFKLSNSNAYLFKFKMLFKEYEEYEDCIRVPWLIINNLEPQNITFRNIIFSEF